MPAHRCASPIRRLHRHAPIDGPTAARQSGGRRRRDAEAGAGPAAAMAARRAGACRGARGGRAAEIALARRAGRGRRQRSAAACWWSTTIRSTARSWPASSSWPAPRPTRRRVARKRSSCGAGRLRPRAGRPADAGHGRLRTGAPHPRERGGEQRPRTPILAVTASAFEDQEQKSRAVGMDGLITKPIGIEQLRRPWISG